MPREPINKLRRARLPATVQPQPLIRITPNPVLQRACILLRDAWDFFGNGSVCSGVDHLREVKREAEWTFADGAHRHDWSAGANRQQSGRAGAGGPNAEEVHKNPLPMSILIDQIGHIAAAPNCSDQLANRPFLVDNCLAERLTTTF